MGGNCRDVCLLWLKKKIRGVGSRRCDGKRWGCMPFFGGLGAQQIVCIDDMVGYVLQTWKSEVGGLFRKVDNLGGMGCGRGLRLWWVGVLYCCSSKGMSRMGDTAL